MLIRKWLNFFVQRMDSLLWNITRVHKGITKPIVSPKIDVGAFTKNPTNVGMCNAPISSYGVPNRRENTVHHRQVIPEQPDPKEGWPRKVSLKEIPKV